MFQSYWHVIIHQNTMQRGRDHLGRLCHSSIELRVKKEGRSQWMDDRETKLRTVVHIRSLNLSQMLRTFSESMPVCYTLTPSNETIRMEESPKLFPCSTIILLGTAV